MKILNMPALVNITSMSLQEILTVVQTQYTAPNEATHLRLLCVYNKVKRVKTLIRWLAWIDQFTDMTTTARDSIVIGDEINYVDRVGYNFTQRRGAVIVIHERTLIVVTAGKTVRVHL